MQMELARYGVQPSEIERDPRPSRLAGLLQAGRVIDARIRLENSYDTINWGGLQGEVKEIGGRPTPPPKTKTILVGYQMRKKLLEERAYPEYHTEEARRQQHEAKQAAMIDDFWNEGPKLPGQELRVKMVREGGEVKFVAADR